MIGSALVVGCGLLFVGLALYSVSARLYLIAQAQQRQAAAMEEMEKQGREDACLH